MIISLRLGFRRNCLSVLHSRIDEEQTENFFGILISTRLDLMLSPLTRNYLCSTEILFKGPYLHSILVIFYLHAVNLIKIIIHEVHFLFYYGKKGGYTGVEIQRKD